MVYMIQAQLTWTTKDGWNTSKQVPTFFLDSNVQGITSIEHAESGLRKDITKLGDATET